MCPRIKVSYKRNRLRTRVKITHVWQKILGQFQAFSVLWFLEMGSKIYKPNMTYHLEELHMTWNTHLLIQNSSVFPKQLVSVKLYISTKGHFETVILFSLRHDAAGQDGLQKWVRVFNIYGNLALENPSLWSLGERLSTLHLKSYHITECHTAIRNWVNPLAWDTEQKILVYTRYWYIY